MASESQAYTSKFHHESSASLGIDGNANDVTSDTLDEEKPRSVDLEDAAGDLEQRTSAERPDPSQLVSASASPSLPVGSGLVGHAGSDEHDNAHNSRETSEEGQHVIHDAHLVQEGKASSDRDAGLLSENYVPIEDVVVDEENAGTAPKVRDAPIVQASPFEPKTKAAPIWRNRKVQLLVFGLVLITSAATLSTVFGVQSTRKNNPAAADGSENGTNDDSLGATKDSFAQHVLPDFTRAALEDPLSHQSIALEWVWKDPATTAELPLFRRIQRYAMAVNFFAGTELTTPDLYGWTSWMKDYHECKWSQNLGENVVCENERIRMILQATNPIVIGTIPPEIALLTNLVVYDVSKTLMKGSIPTQVGLLSDSLEVLRLENTTVSGPVPSEVGSLSALIDLKIFSNALESTLPTELGRLKQLKTIDVHQNNITGPIPTEIGLLTSGLSILSVYSNAMTGPIPSELGTLTSLRFFANFDTFMNGTIPTELGNLRAIEELYVNNTLLIGTIPTEMQSMTNLKYLSLHDTLLTGTFPLCNLVESGSLLGYSIPCDTVQCSCNCSCPQMELDSGHDGS